MGEEYAEINPKLKKFIAKQAMFFVATAPRSDEGLINFVPQRFGNSFVVLDPTTVAYLDLVGSGVETIAHLRENGRIVVMFCSFEGPPLILRLYGRGEAIEPDHPEFAVLEEQFPEEFKAVRSIIRVKLSRIVDSCGYGVPLYSFERKRDQLTAWADKKSEAELCEYQEKNNRTSLDGLPGVKRDLGA